MNKQLIDSAWHALPAEFKEEVKKYYQTLKDQYKDYDRLHFMNAKAKVQERIVALNYFFGIHNLTSDAEGEDEMLCVSRKRVQELYSSYCTERDEEEPGSNRSSLGGRIAMLQELFGSKCLPDEEHPKQKDCDNPLADKEGCKWRNDGKCAFDSACYFEPLNPQEPTDHILDVTKMVDNIIKEGFLKERRCNIAVQMVKAITQSPEIVDRISSTATDSLLDDILSDALYLTDKLIEKCEKGGSK